MLEISTNIISNKSYAFFITILYVHHVIYKYFLSNSLYSLVDFYESNTCVDIISAVGLQSSTHLIITLIQD